MSQQVNKRTASPAPSTASIASTSTAGGNGGVAGGVGAGGGHGSSSHISSSSSNSLRFQQQLLLQKQQADFESSREERLQNMKPMIDVVDAHYAYVRRYSNPIMESVQRVKERIKQQKKQQQQQEREERAAEAQTSSSSSTGTTDGAPKNVDPLHHHPSALAKSAGTAGGFGVAAAALLPPGLGVVTATAPRPAVGSTPPISAKNSRSDRSGVPGGFAVGNLKTTTMGGGSRLKGSGKRSEGEDVDDDE